MSDRLTISATLSVLMMASYVLLGGNAVSVPLGPQSTLPSGMIHVEAPTLPLISEIVPAFR
jgi:hypothetical protein